MGGGGKIGDVGLLRTVFDRVAYHDKAGARGD